MEVLADAMTHASYAGYLSSITKWSGDALRIEMNAALEGAGATVKQRDVHLVLDEIIGRPECLPSSDRSPRAA